MVTKSPELDGSVVGAYPWTVRQVFDKQRFKDYGEMKNWVNTENFLYINKNYSHLVGRNVTVTVGGGDRWDMNRVRRYTGVLTKISGVDTYGCGLFLQQKVRARYIDGWRVVNIQLYEKK